MFLGGFGLKSPVTLWDLSTQLELLRLEAEGDVDGLQLSRDGSVLTGYSRIESDKKFHLWSAPPGRKSNARPPCPACPPPGLGKRRRWWTKLEATSGEPSLPPRTLAHPRSKRPHFASRFWDAPIPKRPLPESSSSDLNVICGAFPVVNPTAIWHGHCNPGRESGGLLHGLDDIRFSFCFAPALKSPGSPSWSC